MGLLDDISGMLPDYLPQDADKRDAAKMGLLAFGASMLANSRHGFGGALGSGLMNGAGAYQQERQDAQRMKLQGLQEKALNLNLQNQQLAFDKARRLEQAYKSFYNNKPEAAPQQGGMMNVSAPADNPAFPRQPGPAWWPQQAAPAAAQPAAATGGADNYSRHLAFAQYLEQGGLPEEAQKYYDLADKFKPKLKEQKFLRDANSNIVTVNVYDDGRTEKVPGYLPAEKLSFHNVGNKTVGLNPFTGKEESAITNTLSPDAAASNAVAWANHRQAGERLSFDRSQAVKPQYHDGVWLTPPTAQNPTGSMVKVPGMPDKPLTEAQGNAMGFGMRAKEAQRLLGALEAKGVYNGGRIAESLGSLPLIGSSMERGMNTAPTLLGGPNDQQQQYAQARRNFITAVLRKESGAAISDAEYANEEKKYFPQPGEESNPGLLEQKRAARELAIQALQTQAGRDLPEAKGAARAKPASKIVALDGGGSATAKLGKDGNYYVTRNGKNYRVEE